MVKIVVISGFLGSGKTTLIRKILKNYKNEKVVVLENEFGEIGIDRDIIQKDGYEVVELENGCICCNIKLSFMKSLLKIIDENKPDRIIIEPTGLGLLSEIKDILEQEELSSKCDKSHFITVVDGVNFIEYMDNFGEFFKNQIYYAESIFISKSQFISEDRIEKIINRIRELNHNANIVRESWDNININDVIDILEFNTEFNIENIEYKYDSNYVMNGIGSMAIEIYNLYTKQELGEILTSLSNPKYGKILRAKGFVKSENGLLQFNYVNGKFEINNNSINTNPKICIIGKDINKQGLNILFRKLSFAIC